MLAIRSDPDVFVPRVPLLVRGRRHRREGHRGRFMELDGVEVECEQGEGDPL
jgi:hypothetical protein